MAAAGEADDGVKSGFRCLDAARYVAAAVVIVLIAAVVVNAIRVVIRPDNINVYVVGNSVTTEMISPLDNKDVLSFSFKLHAVNPGDRVHIYFYNITAYIFENSTVASTPTPMTDCLIFFESVTNMSVPPSLYVDNTRVSNISDDPAVIVPSFFDALYKPGGIVSGKTIRVDGSLVSETRLGFNTSTKQIILYCRDIVVGPADKVATTSSQATTACTPS